MRFIPLSPEDEKRMLSEIGLSRLDDLFASIPDDLRLKKDLNLPKGMSEPEVTATVSGWGEKNRNLPCFLGAGSYAHYAPAAVDHLISRGEFFTAYTPYQPEISQGTLQAIFEFQTMMCGLTGQEISNASMYDGATAVAEAALLACRANGRKQVVVSGALHPEYHNVLRTYLGFQGLEIKIIPWTDDGRTNLDLMRQATGKDTAAVLVQSPNFFGVIEDLAAAAAARTDPDTLFITAVTETISLGLLEPPGSLGADVTAGEAQSLGIPQSFGGPCLGFLTTRDKYKRFMPGRLIGQTLDVDGKRAFVLTLSTREQHIRREKATSNICTNSGLCALTASVFMSMLGPVGFAEMARRNYEKAEYAKSVLTALPGVALEFHGATFNEFVLRLPAKAGAVAERMLAKGFIAGLPMERYFPSMDKSLLVCVTETKERAVIDRYAAAMKEALQ